jgi:DNA-binding transcriptional ArsR family regulator
LSSSARRKVSDDELDLIFHALSDRTRRRVLRSLSQRPAMITEIAAPFDLTLPAVSKHIRVLEKAKLVERTIDGRVHRCALTAAPLQHVEQWLSDQRTFWEENLDSLARFVEREERGKKR